MQNYTEKKVHISYFFLRKTNQKLRKSIFNYYFCKTYQKLHVIIC